MTAFSIQTAYRKLIEQLGGIFEPEEAASIARIVFEDAFGIRNLNRLDKFSLEHIAQLEAITARLLLHEPVQYVLGTADFYGLKFKVDQRVLIPRQETEELVHWVLEENGEAKLKLLDIGAGSGCIPITLKKHRPEWQVEALDVSPDALELARENAERNGVEVLLFQQDILNKSQWEAYKDYDIIVSNPPYIPRAETGLMPEQVLRYEPHLALFVDQGGALLFYQAIAAFALEALKPGGSLFFEANEFHAKNVVQLLEKQGFRPVKLKLDLNGKERMVSGIKPGEGFR